MSEYSYRAESRPVIQLDVGARAAFISKTYSHLFGALALFTFIEIALFNSGLAAPIARAMLGGSWLLVLGAFMVIGWIAGHAAHTAKSLGAQYAALVAFVAAEAIVFVPLLFIADRVAPGAISSAALVTLGGFGGLTMIAFMTRKDFSFLGRYLMWGGFSVLLLIVASFIFGFNLGTWFSVGMIVFAGSAILYDTSNIIRHFPEDRYVAAALELFSSVALLFWYVLRLFIAMRD